MLLDVPAPGRGYHMGLPLLEAELAVARAGGEHAGGRGGHVAGGRRRRGVLGRVGGRAFKEVRDCHVHAAGRRCGR